MYSEKNTLSIQLTEPVLPLRNVPKRAPRYRDCEVPPPAIVRGLLTLTLAKPTKVSSIEVELQAKATTRYSQGSGPSRTDVTEQYAVHSASTVLFKADPLQGRSRSTSTRLKVQFLGGHAGSNAQRGNRHDALDTGVHRATLGPCLAARSASLDPRVSRAGRRLSCDDPASHADRESQHDEVPDDLAPPYSNQADQIPLPGADLYPFAADGSPSIAGSSGFAEPPGSSILSHDSLTSDIPCGSPRPIVHLMRDLSLSRAPRIEETLEDEGEGFEVSASHSGNVAYHGISGMATGPSWRGSEQDHRGRSYSHFSFARVVHIFDAVKDRVRSRSPGTGSRSRSCEQERGRSLIKGKGRAGVSTSVVENAKPLTGIIEFPVSDGANDQNSDSWAIFPQGTYAYPIFFTVPNNSPPTMKADHGSLIWKVTAEVKRPGALKSNMTAQKEVIVVSMPKDDDLEVEGLDLQREWDDQFRYRIQIVGRSFPIGGEIPIQLTIEPLARIKVHSMLIYLEERTEYLTRAETQARSDVMRRATLLAIRHGDFDGRLNEPILPLSSKEPDTLRKSPLYRFMPPGVAESELASSLAGSGPWVIHYQMKLPDSCLILQPSNRIKGSNVMVNHTLKIVLRVEREGDEAKEITTTKRRKIYDIMIHAPIKILSCHCTSEWMLLPRYGEALRSVRSSLDDTLTCPCRARRAKARAHSYAANTLHTPSPSGSLPSWMRLHELLMSGSVSERGEAPPSYEPAHA